MAILVICKNLNFCLQRKPKVDFKAHQGNFVFHIILLKGALFTRNNYSLS